MNKKKLRAAVKQLIRKCQRREKTKLVEKRRRIEEQCKCDSPGRCPVHDR